jgi:hypothetical protein
MGTTKQSLFRRLDWTVDENCDSGRETAII